MLPLIEVTGIFTLIYIFYIFTLFLRSHTLMIYSKGQSGGNYKESNHCIVLSP